MNVLLIGLGSIARKHIKALREIMPDVRITALRSKQIGSETGVAGIRSIYQWDEADENYDFIMITNPTHLHLETIEKAATLHRPLFIEKPPFHTIEGAQEILEHLIKNNVPTYTAFNMRFLPVIEWLKNQCNELRIYEVQVYCGSYLPDWRPGKDYRKIYSANKRMGGGVHLDLIHEIDYVRWIFGDPIDVKASASNISDLEITSFDHAHYWFRYDSKIVTIMLNYYRRDPKRSIEIVMENDTWRADLLEGTVYNSKGIKLFESRLKISDTYKIQMDYFLDTLREGKLLMNGLEESIKTLKLSLSI